MANAPARSGRPTWRDIGPRARSWRVMHAAWSVVQLAALGLVWRCVATRRRSPALWGGVALLAAEGVGLAAGRGNCPMAMRQEAWGDPVPFFELFLPPRAARAAVPALAVVTAAGVAALVLRRPGLALRARPST